MRKGKIAVTSENIFPVIKKFLYSDQEIFLREIISNAVDATQKLKILIKKGEATHELKDETIHVKLDKKNKTITVSDNGVGMTEEELVKYLNQIAFSSAEEFLEKYKDDKAAIIGHFGLGFFSSFMVSKKVEVITKSWKKEAKPVKWSCEGTPKFSITDAKREKVGTDVIMHIDDDNTEFLEDDKTNELLDRYCKFLPISIAFGKKKEWKDDKEVETDADNIINNTKPAWTQQPADLSDESYKSFYKELYPSVMEEPMFHIHLNVDYPFNLTGILYFPKIRQNIDIQKNKIQMYCNQVFVTDSVEGIVPEFLTLLHGVIDSPDIPLNISRSFLQNDRNVKKISGHITKKVADKLQEIFKTNRKEFEEKWNDMKVFIEYGMLTEEKFYDRAKDFVLLKNTDGKYFTLDEYKDIVKDNQTDKNKQLIYLYATDKDAQYSYINDAKDKGYDVLLMDGQIDTHFVNHLESKLDNTKFVRVDADVVDKIIDKDEGKVSEMSDKDQKRLVPVFQSQVPGDSNYIITPEPLDEKAMPVMITREEFMRRMKDMSQLSGGMYDNLPDSYKLIVNTNHPLIKEVNTKTNKKLGEKLDELDSEIDEMNQEINKLDKEQQDKKQDEIKQADKDKLKNLRDKLDKKQAEKDEKLKGFGNNTKLVKQLVDLALLSNNMLKGEALNKFVRRSIDMIKK
ncbi:MAG: molecular chaperone HtpG [Bacteroidota bacterium]|nr:molecular chaperone HtpG [Bacteroidota bacterium]